MFVLEEAVRMKFDGTAVEVVTVGDLRKLQGGSLPSGDAIREFIKINSHCKIFIDELPVPLKDLKNVMEGKGTDVGETLQILESYSKQTMIALSTLSLLDNSENPEKHPAVQFSDFAKSDVLRKSLTRKTTFHFCSLDMRLRNSSSIGSSAPNDISDLSKTDLSFQTSVIKGASNTSTIIGLRPTFVQTGDDDFAVTMEEKLENIFKLRKPHATEHAVILCGEAISLTKVSQAATQCG